MNTYSRRRFLKLGSKTIAGAGLALGANPFHSLAHGAEAISWLGSVEALHPSDCTAARQHCSRSTMKVD